MFVVVRSFGACPSVCLSHVLLSLWIDQVDFLVGRGRWWLITYWQHVHLRARPRPRRRSRFVQSLHPPSPVYPPDVHVTYRGPAPVPHRETTLNSSDYKRLQRLVLASITRYSPLSVVASTDQLLFICPSLSWQLSSIAKLEEASSHDSTKTHAGNVFVTRDLDLLTFK